MKASDILAGAKRELGTAEIGNTNQVKYNDWYYGRHVEGADYPWCMAFVQYIFAHYGTALPYKTASCSALLNWYKQHKPEAVKTTGQPGDIVIYSGHTGIYETAGGAKDFVAIEGNYSNKVTRVNRRNAEVIAYIRPDYGPDWPDWAAPTLQKLTDMKVLNTPDCSYDLMRTLVILDRLGLIDRKEGDC